MRHVPVTLFLTLAFWVDVSAAQTVAAGRDICSTAWFHDGAARQEFSRLSNILEKTDRHRDAIRVSAETSEILLKRLTSIPRVDLLEPRLAAERAARESARAPELAAVQAQLTTYCLERLRRSPDSFTAALLTQAARHRHLAGLSDDGLIAAFSSDTAQLTRDLGTPQAAARTIRIVLAGAR
jgi:hypothetical protein